VASTGAELRANKARYYRNKFGHVFTTSPAIESQEAVESKLAGVIRGSFFVIKGEF
jgi:hypothetical protein